jgi:hypothetical protein
MAEMAKEPVLQSPAQRVAKNPAMTLVTCASSCFTAPNSILRTACLQIRIHGARYLLSQGIIHLSQVGRMTTDCPHYDWGLDVPKIVLVHE